MQLDEHQRRHVRDDKCTASVINNDVHVAQTVAALNNIVHKLSLASFQ